MEFYSYTKGLIEELNMESKNIEKSSSDEFIKKWVTMKISIILRSTNNRKYVDYG
ncbi:hypothetical protein [Paraclostridium sordellii]|uniref:hypothetical protein n=1 Tax=Paraclostridium sordellii TaxID=1505 RepID=UPI0022E348EF|nr:hypothetical protein [Paeniclostridium sordellii]